LYKAEVVHRRFWPNFETADIVTLAWANWFKHNDCSVRSGTFRQRTP
jgi:hypothetical protein